MLNSVSKIDSHLACAPYRLPYSLQLIPVYPTALTAFPRFAVFDNGFFNFELKLELGFFIYCTLDSRKFSQK